MREQFELCVKVVGLCLMVGSILLALSAVLVFFHRYGDDIYQRPGTGSNSTVALQLQEHGQLVSSRIRAWFTVHMLLSGVAGGVLGACLMHWAGLVARVAYPRQAAPSRSEPGSGPVSDVRFPGQSAKEEETESRPDKRYAPPGYFQ